MTSATEEPIPIQHRRETPLMAEEEGGGRSLADQLLGHSSSSSSVVMDLVAATPGWIFWGSIALIVLWALRLWLRARRTAQIRKIHAGLKQ